METMEWGLMLARTRSSGVMCARNVFRHSSRNDSLLYALYGFIITIIYGLALFSCSLSDLFLSSRVLSSCPVWSTWCSRRIWMKYGRQLLC
jgi:hypothetical protein